MQHVTALALVPLILYALVGFFNNVVSGNGYGDAVDWLHSPLNATAVLMFLLIALRHAVIGLQIVSKIMFTAKARFILYHGD